MLPKVSIIWLNYNSWSNIDIVKFSLESCLNLDYPNYEVIVVDNGSTDGSFETVKEIAEKKTIVK
jgi:glycosyltransferase involved in cell wall biosynthesis